MGNPSQSGDFALGRWYQHLERYGAPVRSAGAGAGRCTSFRLGRCMRRLEAWISIDKTCVDSGQSSVSCRPRSDDASLLDGCCGAWTEYEYMSRTEASPFALSII